MIKRRIFYVLMTIVVILVIGLIVGYFYSKNFPTGILWRNGITNSDVILTLNTDNNFRHYLYTKEGNISGILTLQRREKSKLWSEYYNSQDLSIIDDSPKTSLAKSSYPIYTDAQLVSRPIWGGVVDLNNGEYKSIRLLVNNELREPTDFKIINDNYYFIFDATDFTIDHKIKIIPQK